MPIHEPQYFSSPETHDWLDEFSRDRSFIDPRTYEVHQVGWTQYPARWNSRLASSNLERLEKRTNATFVQEWVQKTVLMTETVGYDPVPLNDIIDVDSELEDDLEELAELKRMFPIQLEAVPPFPKQSYGHWDNSLFAAHMQAHGFQHLSDCSPHETSDGESRPAGQLFSETTSIVVSSLPKPQESYEELNIGRLIVGKFRQAVVHGREAYRSLHNLKRS